jgi:hypothetical protein
MVRIKRSRRVVTVSSTERVRVSFQPPVAPDPVLPPASPGGQLAAAGQWLVTLATMPELAALRDELIAMGERLVALGMACQ